MIDFGSKLGARAAQRLNDEFVVWLTTIDPGGSPQPRPVWFIWDGEAFLIYSQPNTGKLRHIAHNPNVALHFDGGPKGLDIQVFLGTAEIVTNPIPVHQVEAYVEKYRQEIQNMGATVETFGAAYSVALRVTPARLRGMLASG